MSLSEFYDPLRSNRLSDQSFAMGITGDDILVPSYNFLNSSYFRPWRVYMENAIHDFGSAISQEKDKYKISLDVQQFRPNEILVKTKGNDIIVQGKHDDRTDEHGCVSREFTRKYKIPVDCDPNNVTSSLTKDGVLIITAAKKYCEGSEEKETVIPIKMCETWPTMQLLQNQTNADSKTDKIKSKLTEEKKVDESKLLSLTDDHSMMLNNESSLKFTMLGGTDKIRNEASKESCEELLQMSAGSFDKTNMAAKSDLTGFSSKTSESTQSKETSYSSSMSYDMKVSSEKTSEYKNEIIATALKQASEGM